MLACDLCRKKAVNKYIISFYNPELLSSIEKLELDLCPDCYIIVEEKVKSFVEELKVV